ncbi:hypothetical protein ACIBH1_37780 [Nonomuraea sp. NPDC050663]|uniref:hypothetical protein n=1 Tax=Nonomuraea sp. NPDC050663 TaxID=3364370 RepID=UPI003790E743
MDTEAIRLLRRHRQRQHLDGLDTVGRVFTREDGRPIRPDYLTYRFRYLVKASGLPPVRLHDLRHGAASTALAAHVDAEDRPQATEADDSTPASPRKPAATLRALPERPLVPVCPRRDPGMTHLLIL